MSNRFGFSSGKYGLAVLPYEAYVFFQRVKEATKDTGESRPRLLGHIIVHELGHLLLESEGHSDIGIMSKHIYSGTCTRPGVISLVFTRQQGVRMRNTLTKVDPIVESKCGRL